MKYKVGLALLLGLSLFSFTCGILQKQHQVHRSYINALYSAVNFGDSSKRAKAVSIINRHERKYGILPVTTVKGLKAKFHSEKDKYESGVMSSWIVLNPISLFLLNSTPCSYVSQWGYDLSESTDEELGDVIMVNINISEI